MKKILFLFTFILFDVYAEELTLKQVLDTTEKHHPIILMNLYQLEEAAAKAIESDGAFDTQLDISSTERKEGYYDGSFWDASLTKPLKLLNAKIYTGFRKSSGELPVYETQAQTQDDGEARVGFQFSLLGNRSIDEKRLKLWNEQFNAQIQENEVKQVKLELEAEAQSAFWKWQTAGQMLAVYEKLYDVAMKRNVALEKRVKKGDLARIYLTENRQYILKRKSLVLESRQKFQHATLYLAFFYRDENGNILIPQKSQLSQNISVPDLFAYEKLDNDIKEAIKKSPYLVQIQLKEKQQKNELEFGESLNQPTLDLKLEQSRDYGTQLDQYQEDERKLMLEFNLPLGRSFAQGRMQQARAKLKRLEVQKLYVKDQFRLRLTNLYQAMLNEYQIIVNSTEEVKAAQALEQAENAKFSRGASDFFLVNIREQNTASAEVKLIETKLKYMQNYIAYQNSLAGVYHKKIQ